MRIPAILILTTCFLAGCGEQRQSKSISQGLAEAMASQESEPQTIYTDVPTPEQKLAMQQRYRSENIRGLDQNDNLQAEGEFLSFLNARPGSREEVGHWRSYQDLVERGAANVQRANDDYSSQVAAEEQREGQLAAAKFRSACQSPERLTRDEASAFLSFSMRNSNRASAAGLWDPAWEGCEARVEARHNELMREANRDRLDKERAEAAERAAATPRESRVEYTGPPPILPGPPVRPTPVPQ